MLFRPARTAEPPAQGRIAGHGPVAVIDIGSNSVRLVVYERLARSPTPLFNEKTLAGLGAAVAEKGRLAAGPMEKAKKALRRFAALARQMDVVETNVLATAAVREAENGSDFIAEVEAICGVPVTILTGLEEARLAALGIVAGFQDADGVAGDLGGGSLELTDIRGAEVGTGESLLLGGLRLQADAKGSLKQAREIARRTFESSTVLGGLSGRTFYAIGGTWRSLARLHMRECGYPLHVMHGYRIPLSDMEEFLKPLARGSFDAIPGLSVVSKQRRTLLPLGAIVLAELLRAGKPRFMTVSALGLREGLLFSKLDAETQSEDALLSAARELAMLRSRCPAHGEELIDWSGAALRALGIDETAEEARLRAAACLLADIGWRAHPDYRGEQSFNIIAHAAFVGVDHPGRAYLALAAYYRHAGLSDEELGTGLREIAPVRYLMRARALAATFRVAYLISGSMRGVLPRTAIRQREDVLELVLAGDLADLAGNRLASRLKQLASLGGLTSAIVRE